MIDFDFKKAARQEQELRDIAEDIKRLHARTLPDILQNVSRSWSGEACNQFIRQCEALREDLMRDERRVRENVDRLRRISQKMRSAEEAARRAIQD